MSAHGKNEREEIHSKVLRAGRRTYFFDVRSTRADDYYLTITESKKHTSDSGHHYYKKHKIYLYKEDFDKFKDLLDDVTNFIIDQKGEEVISDRHQSDFAKNEEEEQQYSQANEAEQNQSEENNQKKHATADINSNAYTDVSFDDI